MTQQDTDHVTDMILTIILTRLQYDHDLSTWHSFGHVHCENTAQLVALWEGDIIALALDEA